MSEPSQRPLIGAHPFSYREVLQASYRTSTYGAGNPNSPAMDAARNANYDLQFSDLLPKDRGARIVDLGCGSGFLLAYLLRAGFAQAIGVDSSKEQAEYAMSNGLPVRHGDAIEFIKTTGPYDSIIATDFIEHLTKDEIVDFLEAALGALEPGGRIILSTPNISSLFGPSARYFDFTHEMAFTENSLRQVLVSCGFHDVMIRDNRIPFGFRPKRLLRWALYNLQHLFLRIVFSIEVGEDRPRLLGKLLFAVASKRRPAHTTSA